MSRPPIWTSLTTSGGDSYSFARVAGAIIVAASIFWGTVIVFSKGVIPDFTSLGVFLLSVYGANRAAEAYENKPAKTPPTE